jgi:NhaA family Na+:H+ antiporter
MTSAAKVNEPYPLERMFGRLVSPLEEFQRRSTAGGIVLLAATVATLVIANSPVGGAWERFWLQPFAFTARPQAIEHTLREWVNDGLMAIFFLVVGLELKREVLVGELASLRDAALPILAAIGGMVVPAAIYLAFNPAAPTSSGWGVPMATDIAFAIGTLVMLGDRTPRGLLVFLMALAIADDLGAVLVIAFAYTHGLKVGALAAAGGVLVLLALANRAGVRRPLPYVILGVALWYFISHSGVHGTIAGILLALAIPARPSYTPQQFDARVLELHSAFRTTTEDPTTPSDALTSHDMATIAAALERDARAVQSPLHRTEGLLEPWVAYVILPLFALANAAIDFGNTNFAESFTSSVTLGILFGLPLGKFFGITAASYLAVRFGWARLPAGVQWRHLAGAGWLGGIGFTMSLFISQLAFDEANVQLAKVGILTASVASGIIGVAWLAAVARSSR